MSTELELVNTEVVPAEPLTVDVGGSVTTTVQERESIVEGYKREYSIVGDGLYASVSAEEAPQWLTSIIDSVISNQLANGLVDLGEARNSILVALDEVEIAKNQYQELINIEATVDGILASRLATLNATLNQNSASILELQATKVTADLALAIAADKIEAELNDGAIRSEISRIDTAFATQSAATAQSFDTVMAVLDDLGEGLSGQANATTTLYSYVGVTPGTDNPNGTGLLADVAILQKQNDGVIETTTGTYDVMLGIESPNNNTDNDELVVTAEPYASWKAADDAAGTEDARLAHIGDVYIKYATTINGGKEYITSYKFIKTVPDETSPKATDEQGFTWAKIVDQAAELAYTAALNAYDLADGKRRVFVGLGATTTPIPPYDAGDLWLIDVERTVNGTTRKVGDILRAVESKKSPEATYEENDWVLASSYADAIAAEAEALEEWKTNVYSTFVSDIQSQVDKKAESFYIDTAPHPEGANLDYAVWVGDLWKKPTTNQEYIYQLVSGVYKWVETDVPDVVYDTIDGKKAIYTGNSLPTGTPEVPVQVNDMWITGDNPVGGYVAKSIYVWDGANWVLPTRYTDDNAVTLLQTGLENGTVAVDLSNATIDGTTPLDQFVQNQIDNQVVVYSGTDHTTQTGMKADDIYIEKTTETANGGVIVDVVNTYKYSGSAWVQIGNNNNLTNLADLADGKRSIYAGSTTPENQGYVPEERDIWIPEANNGTYLKGEVYQFDGTTWLLATTYTENLDNFKEAVNTEVTDLQNQIDGKITTYYRNTAPYPNGTDDIKLDGDLWYDLDNNKLYVYRYDTRTWQEVQDQTAIDAVQAAANAQATADGKVNSFYAVRQTTQPMGSQYKYWFNSSDNELYTYENSIWVKVPEISGNGVTLGEGDTLRVWDPLVKDYFDYFYNGSSWVQETAEGLVARSGSITNLDLRLTSGEGTWLTADSALENTLNGKITDEGAKVESKFAYNSTLTLNGVTYNSGFGLATSINDAGIPVGSSEFWVKADAFKLLSPDGTRAAPFSVVGDVTYLNNAVIGGSENTVLQTSLTGQRVIIGSDGIRFTTGATGGKWGTFKFGERKYGSGVLAYLNNPFRRVPFYVSTEQNVCDIHYYNRENLPTGAIYEAGDTIVVQERLYIYAPSLGGWRRLALDPL